MPEIGDVPPPVAPSVGESEAFRSRLVDELPDAVIIVDAKGQVKWGNRTAELLFQRSVSDSTTGVSGLDLVHPDDLELALRSLVSVQGKAVGAPIEIRLKTSSGWRLMELVGAPLAWLEDGAVLLAMRDLTQRRRFELVHDHDARLRSLVHNSAAITMLVSPDGCVESVSGAVTRQLGHDPEVIEGRPLSELVPEPHHTVLDGAFEQASRGASVAGPVTVTLPMIRHGNKETLPFELSFVNLIDDPTVGGYVVTGHDVTERRVADLELRTALSLLKATLDATADGILVVSTDGQVVSFNQRRCGPCIGDRRRARARGETGRVRLQDRADPPAPRGGEQRPPRAQGRTGVRAGVEAPDRRRNDRRTGMELPGHHRSESTGGTPLLRGVSRFAHLTQAVGHGQEWARTGGTRWGRRARCGYP